MIDLESAVIIRGWWLLWTHRLSFRTWILQERGEKMLQRSSMHPRVITTQRECSSWENSCGVEGGILVGIDRHLWRGDHGGSWTPEEANAGDFAIEKNQEKPQRLTQFGTDRVGWWGWQRADQFLLVLGRAGRWQGGSSIQDDYWVSCFLEAALPLRTTGGTPRK